MKNKIYLLSAVLLMNVLQSCKDEVEENDAIDSFKHKAVEGLNLRALYSENHVISVSEASEIALKAPEMFAGEFTRANDFTPRVIESVGVYGGTNPSLRSASASGDTLVYVFNFEDNRGFAIVAADDRIPTQLLAYVDEGVLENEVDNSGLQFALEQMQNYVEFSIEKFEATKDSMLAISEKNSYVVDGKSAETRAIYTGTAYQLLSESRIGPLLEVTWSQGYPYNMHVDKICTTGKAPVGCVATATAQIMSYWKYPSMLNQYAMNWDSMSSEPEPMTYSNQENVARLMREVGREVGMEYGCDGSGAETSDAYNLLGRLGYKKAFSKSFNSSDVRNAIELRRPILVDGFRVKRTTGKLWWKTTHYEKGHAWVIDGCIVLHYKQENYRINTSTGEYTSTFSYYDENYFHNNWGYSGEGNGYFAAGCFNMQDAYLYDNTPFSELRDYRYKNEMYCVYR